MQQARQQDRQESAPGHRPARRGDKIVAEAEQEQADGQDRNRGENQFSRKKKANPVGQVIYGFEQELADVAVLDVGGNLPVVLIDRRERVHDGDQQVIRDHGGQGIAGHFGFLAAVNGLPEVDGGQERNERDGGAKEEIEAVHEHVLGADFHHMPVLFHWRRAGDAQATMGYNVGSSCKRHSPLLGTSVVGIGAPPKMVPPIGSIGSADRRDPPRDQLEIIGGDKLDAPVQPG